jgi:hypothetical protein
MFQPQNSGSVSEDGRPVRVAADPVGVPPRVRDDDDVDEDEESLIDDCALQVLGVNVVMLWLGIHKFIYIKQSCHLF